MSLALSLSAYLNLNLLIALGLAGLGVFSWGLRLLRLKASARTELQLHYGILLTVLVLAFAHPILHPLLPKHEVFRPAAKVWSAQSIKSFGQDYSAADKGGYLSLPLRSGEKTLEADQVANVWILLAITLLAFGGAFLVRDIRSLIRVQRHAFLVRKIGRVGVLVSDQIRVPFSYWLPGQANVVIPTDLVSRPQDYKIAMAHELQHHRHGDTRWVYALWGLRLLCVINPAVHIWNRWIMEIQEFACDETLVDRNKVESQAYARCLVEVAKTAVERTRVPVCATGLTFLTERNLLKRRIERMFSTKTSTVNRKISVSVGICLALLMSGVAYASKGLVQDRRVSMAQAKAMAARAQASAQLSAGGSTGMPVVVNDLVLKQLNRYIGTPEGREFMRSALARMENHKSMVGDHLEKYGVPAEILALPIIESGYQNLAQGAGSPTNKSAGLWQFIPQTARNYGLRVDTQKDERLDTLMLTDAAMRYLQANNLRFKDWHLSLMAYNMGENAVQKAMTDLDTRDAWTLIRNGREGDKDYLAKFVAAVLIMRNPDSVE